MPFHLRPLPPVYFLCALLLMVFLDRDYPMALLVTAPLNYGGIPFIALGLGISAGGALLFHQAGTPVVPFEPARALVTAGLYRFSRNPMYLGLVIILGGVWLLLGTLTPLLVPPAFFVLLQRAFVRREERILEQTFGDEYRDYRRRVRRWL